MPSERVVIRDEVGLHARPAARFVSTAKDFEAAIVVRNGDREANGKSLISVLQLEAMQGAEVEIHTEGSDAEAALLALVDLLSGGVGDE